MKHIWISVLVVSIGYVMGNLVLPPSDCPAPMCICSAKEATKGKDQHETAMCTAIPATKLTPYINTLKVVTVLESVSSDTVISILEHLQNLDLSQCEIKTLEAGSFNTALQLVSLDLHDNNLFEIDQNTFGKLPQLIKLYLNNNELQVIMEGAFFNLVNLQELYLENNALTQIPGKLPSNLIALNVENNKIGPTITSLGQVNLTVLNLCGNIFQEFPNTDMVAVHNLHTLCIGKSVTVFHPEVAEKMQKISNISLLAEMGTQTVLTSKTLEELGRMITLTSLSIVHYKIQSLSFLYNLTMLQSLRLEDVTVTGAVREDYLFINKGALIQLYLDGSPLLAQAVIQNIDGMAQLSHLNILSLKDTQLQYLSPGHIPNNPNLVLDISSNPLHCDCSIKWVKYTVKQLLSYSSTKCATPENANGKFFLKYISLLSCPRENTSTQDNTIQPMADNYDVYPSSTYNTPTYGHSTNLNEDEDNHTTLYIALGSILVILAIIGIILAIVYRQYKKKGLNKIRPGSETACEPTLQQLQTARSEDMLLKK